MESDVVPPPEMAPSEDGLEYRIYLLELDVVGPESTGAPGRVPLVLKYSTQAFRATGVCENVQCGTGGLQNLDAIP